MKKTVFLLLFYVLCWSLQAQSWEITEIDNGIKPSIALNDANTPFIAYMNEKFTGFIRVAEQDGDDFNISNIDDGYFYGPLDIAIGNFGHPRVSYHDHNNEDGVLMVRSSSGWFKYVIMSSNHDGWDATVAIDQFNDSHVASVDPTVGLEYAKLDNGTWNFETPGSGAFMYRHGTSIALSSNDLPHICYYKDNDDRLELAKKNGNSWEIGLVEAGGRFPSLVLDEDNNPIVAYYKRMAGPIGEVKVATYSNGSWDRETVDTLNNVELTFSGARNVVSLQIGPEGYLHLSYGDKYKIFYAKKEDDSWDIDSVVDVDGLGIDLGQQTSLAVDNLGFAHIAYYERTNQNQDGGIIKYAHNQNLFMFLIACPPEVTVVCETEPDTTMTGLPEILNNPADSVFYDYTDIIKPSPCGMAPDTIERHWMVSNEMGNFDQCVQIIYSKHYDRDMTDFPGEFNYNNECFFVPSTNQTGDVEGLCLNIVSSFEDSLLTTSCEENVTIRRRFYIEDWCQNVLDSIDQLIHFNNYEAIGINSILIFPDDGDSTGSISYMTECGIPDYTYLWSNESTTQNISNLEAGIYTLTITDRIGCTFTNEFTVNPATPLPSISGYARNMNAMPLSNIEAQVNFLTEPSYPYEVCEQPNGTSFAICFDDPFSVTGSMELCLDKDDVAAAGTSGSDVVKAQLIILGLVDACPYNVIAADVNQNGTVSGSDLVIMSRVILGLNSDFPNNISWRFFLENTDFPPGENPLDILEANECAIIDAVNFPVTNLEFTGVKLGNLDCQDDPLFGDQDPEVNIRDRNIARLKLSDLRENNDILGYLRDMEGVKVAQLALDLSETDLEILSLQLNPYYQTSNLIFDYVIQDHFVKILLLHPQGITLDPDQYLIKLFGNDQPLNGIKLLSTPAWHHEMVDANGFSYSLELNISDQSSPGSTNLYLRPNPFQNGTELIITSDEPLEQADLLLYNIQGKLLLRKQLNFPAGINTVALSANQFKTAGTYIVKLLTGQNSYTRKAIYIK